MLRDRAILISRYLTIYDLSIAFTRLTLFIYLYEQFKYFLKDPVKYDVKYQVLIFFYFVLKITRHLAITRNKKKITSLKLVTCTMVEMPCII